MRKKGEKDSFWPSYVDIVTTLFAIMVVLFAVSYSRFSVKDIVLLPGDLITPETN